MEMDNPLQPYCWRWTGTHTAHVHTPSSGNRYTLYVHTAGDGNG
jgi:hypothetical protein